MSDPFSQSPRQDPPSDNRLPARQPDGETSSEAEAVEPPQQISLDEMMERLQRSGTGSSSGRRRRSSSPSSRAASERRSSAIRPGSDAGEPNAENDPSLAFTNQDRSRTVLPPPRHGESERPTATRVPRAAGPAPRRRFGWYVLAGLLLLGLGVWFGIRMLNRWRIEGDGFRVNTGRRLSELADRRIVTARFQQTAGNQLNTASLSIQPVLQDLLASVSFVNVTADFTAASSLADAWTVRSLRIQQGSLAFQPVKTIDENMWAMLPAPVDRGATPGGGFRIGMTAEPASVEIETGRFDELNLTWPGPDGKPESLSGMQAGFRTFDQTILLEIAGGLLDTASWPPFPIQQIQAKLRGSSLEIVSARLGFTAGHEVRVTGSAQLVPEGQMQLKADISSIALKHLLPDVWRSLALGSFAAEGAVWTSTFKPGGTDASFSGPFRVRGFVLRGLPFVEKIANLLRKPELVLLEFPALTGQFQWTPTATTLTDLTASTGDGLVRLKGSVTVQPGGEISSELTIEANEAYFAGLPPDLPALFTPGPEGWRSLAFAISNRDGSVTDTIGVAQPVLIEKRPVPTAVEAPQISLPNGVTGPPAPTAAPARRPPVKMVPPAPRPAPVVVPPPSDQELERQFKDLLGR